MIIDNRIAKYFALCIIAITAIYLLSNDKFKTENLLFPAEQQNYRFRRFLQTHINNNNNNKFAHQNDHVFKINSGNNNAKIGIPYARDSSTQQHNTNRNPTSPPPPHQHQTPQQTPQHNNQAPPQHNNQEPPQPPPQTPPPPPPSPPAAPVKPVTPHKHHFEPPHIDAKSVFNLEFPTLSQNSSSTKGKVYYSIMADRQEFMKIHLKYAEWLLRKKLVDSVHIWNFCEQENDEKFLLDYLKSKETDTTVTFEYFEVPTMSANARETGQLWRPYYEYYSSSSDYEDEDIFIKADDDIVFVDVEKFDDFIRNIQTANVYFPNIVNNDAGLFIQGSRHAHESAKFPLRIYAQNFDINFASKFAHYYGNEDIQRVYESPMKTIFPLSGTGNGNGWDEAWIMQGDWVDALHQGFLENPKKFIAACSDAAYPRIVSLKQRISMNMFAGKIGMIKKLFHLFLEYQCCDFEGYLGKWPSLTHWDHWIDTSFTVVHYAFNMQVNTDSEDLKRFVSQYDTLADQTLSSLK